jgi:hypothetical protein
VRLLPEEDAMLIVAALAIVAALPSEARMVTVVIGLLHVSIGKG